MIIAKYYHGYTRLKMGTIQIYHIWKQFIKFDKLTCILNQYISNKNKIFLYMWKIYTIINLYLILSFTLNYVGTMNHKNKFVKDD